MVCDRRPDVGRGANHLLHSGDTSSVLWCSLVSVRPVFTGRFRVVGSAVAAL